MESGLREARNYITLDGKIPFEEWVNSLKDKKVQVAVFDRINRVILGNFGDCKHLGDEIYELRIHYGPGYRIYFADINGAIVVLLCGGTKSSQSKDIKKAKKYWLELKNHNI